MKQNKRLFTYSFAMLLIPFLSIQGCSDDTTGPDFDEDGDFILGDGVTDIDGNEYVTVIIGEQEWMAENLRTTKFNNGDQITNVTDNSQWADISTPAWAHYDNDSQYENPFGLLYNGYVIDGSRNVCPEGWIVPSDDDWNILIGYLDPSFDPDSQGTQSSTAGGKMKSTGTEHWEFNNEATNESGFTGLPGGFRNQGGVFSNLGERGQWWASADSNTSFAYTRILQSANSVSRTPYSKKFGLSIRCLKK